MKKIVLLLMVFGMIGLVLGAVSLSNYLTKDNTLSSGSYDKFNAQGITGYSISPIVCYDKDSDGNNDYCDPIRLKIDGVIDQTYIPTPHKKTCLSFSNESDLACLQWGVTYYTNQEMLDKRNKWEASQIAKAENYLDRLASSPSGTEISEGVDVTLKRGK